MGVLPIRTPRFFFSNSRVKVGMEVSQFLRHVLFLKKVSCEMLVLVGGNWQKMAMYIGLGMRISWTGLLLWNFTLLVSLCTL